MSGIIKTTSTNPITPTVIDGTSGPTVEQEKEVGRGQIGGNSDLPPVDPTAYAPIGRDQKTEDPGKMEKELAEALEKLKNDPAFRDQLLAALGGASNAEEIAALLIKLSSMNRENVLDQRLQARAAARSDLEGAATEMKEAAVKQVVAAVVSAVVSAATAVVSVVSAFQSIGKSVDAIKASKEANQMEKIANVAKDSGDKSAPKLTETFKNTSALAEQKTLDARRLSDIGGAISKLGGSAGELTSGSLQGASKVDESEAKQREASATDHQAHSDVTKKAMDDLEEMVKSAIQFLKAMQQAEVDLMANLTRV